MIPLGIQLWAHLEPITEPNTWLIPNKYLLNKLLKYGLGDSTKEEKNKTEMEHMEWKKLKFLKKIVVLSALQKTSLLITTFLLKVHFDSINISFLGQYMCSFMKNYSLSFQNIRNKCMWIPNITILQNENPNLKPIYWSNNQYIKLEQSSKNPHQTIAWRVPDFRCIVSLS